MKRLVICLAIICSLVLSACGSGDAAVSDTQQGDPNAVGKPGGPTNDAGTSDNSFDFAMENTRWEMEDGPVVMTFQGDGTAIAEQNATGTQTSTSNGNTTTHSSSASITTQYTWVQEGNNVVLNNMYSFTIEKDGDSYKLVGDSATYVLAEENVDTASDGSGAISLEPEVYTLNNLISTDTVELQFTEQGIADDIRITSRESGISITSGPSPESGKRFVFIRGTVKNLSTHAVMVNLVGAFDIDGYSYDMDTHTIDANGNPLYTIDPLETMTITLYAAVPAELIDNYSRANLLFGFNDEFGMSALHDCQYQYVYAFTQG